MAYILPLHGASGFVRRTTPGCARDAGCRYAREHDAPSTPVPPLLLPDPGPTWSASREGALAPPALVAAGGDPARDRATQRSATAIPARAEALGKASARGKYHRVYSSPGFTWGHP